MRWGLLGKRFWRKGIRGAFQGIFRAGWPWTYFLCCSLSAAPFPLQICSCFHGSFFCFWSGGNWYGGSWFGFSFLFCLGHWRVLSDVCRDRCCHWLWYVYRCWCRCFCRGWCRCFCRRGSCGLIPGFLGRFLFFSSDFHPLLHCFWLGLVRLFFTSALSDGDYGSCRCCGFCSDCGGCSSWSFWRIFFGAELGYVPQLLAALTARTSAFHNHHHLPPSADDDFRNCLKALPSKAHPEHVVPVGCPGCWPKQIDLLYASMRAEEGGQNFCYERRDVADGDPNPTDA